MPRGGATVPAGTVAVGGTAWAQHTGITGVEVQVDDGPWSAADLSAKISVDTWRQWSWSWSAEPGAHTLRVRMVDPGVVVEKIVVAPVGEPARDSYFGPPVMDRQPAADG